MTRLKITVDIWQGYGGFGVEGDLKSEKLHIAMMGSSEFHRNCISVNKRG